LGFLLRRRLSRALLVAPRWLGKWLLVIVAGIAGVGVVPVLGAGGKGTADHSGCTQNDHTQQHSAGDGRAKRIRAVHLGLLGLSVFFSFAAGYRFNQRTASDS